MKKRWTAALLALVLAAALLPAPARAAGADYSAGARLTGADQAVYQALRTEIAKIAAGTRSSTTIRVPDQDDLSWTPEELGAGSGGNVLDKVDEQLKKILHIDRIMNCLVADCPFDLYWKSNEIGWGYTLSRRDGRHYVTELTVYIQVAQAYRGSVSSVSSAKAAAARKATENAQAIVDKYRDKSDYEKLVAYRDEICQLVSYDIDALRPNVPYGDPWEVVSVFDGDHQTNVVCEGYAKAFQYLCDLSEFDGDVASRIVRGTMDGGSHMWNVVRMDDGQDYLVDVTNCDSGTIGSGGRLFLTGGVPSNDGQTYTVATNESPSVYTYGDDQKDMFTDGWLALSGSGYVYDPSRVPARPVGGFSDVLRGQYFADPVIWAVEEGITKGTSDTTFSPSDPCTHGQILTFLWRAAGEPEPAGQAPDGVKPEDYFYDAVRWAAGKEMLDDGFDPEAGCSRADAVRYIWRAFDSPSAPASAFTDVPEGVPYALAVDWAVDKEVTNGATDTTFDPDTICTRGQIVTFLYRAYH